MDVQARCGVAILTALERRAQAERPTGYAQANRRYLSIYWVGPLVGAGAMGYAYKFLFQNNSND